MIETHCASRQEYADFLDRPELRHARELEQHLTKLHHGHPTWYLVGYCRACQGPRDLLVDRLWGGAVHAGVWVPAWRERVECEQCRLNNRQRLVAGQLREVLEQRPAGADVYLTEAITLFAQWAGGALEGTRVVGSEFLPDEQARAYLPEHLKGTRHEDVTALTFADECLDVIVTNDVLEHVPTPGNCFEELARVLRPGGQLLMTIPMDVGADESVTRATLDGDQVTHLLDPVYHGNPVAAEEGSLVFTDFGWDVLDQLRCAGFAAAGAHATWSALYGHLGSPQVVIRATK